MGPVRYMATQVFERRHKTLKNLSRRANNFKNITKTLSYRNQAELVYNGFTYIDDLDCGKLSTLNTETLDHNELSLITSVPKADETIYEIQYFKLNNFVYREGTAILVENQFCVIERIVVIGVQYYFLCHPLDYLNFHKFTHSLIVDKMSANNARVIDVNDLSHKTPYEVKNLNGNFHIFADTLDVKNAMQQCYQN